LKIFEFNNKDDETINNRCGELVFDFASGLLWNFASADVRQYCLQGLTASNQ
jgi:hypothetical protein